MQFKDPKGKESTSRRIAFIVVCTALLFSGMIIIMGYFSKESIIAVAGSSAAYFTAVASPILLWIYGQKKTEEGK